MMGYQPTLVKSRKNLKVLFLLFNSFLIDKQQEQYVVDLTKYKGIYYNDDNKKF